VCYFVFSPSPHTPFSQACFFGQTAKDGLYWRAPQCIITRHQRWAFPHHCQLLTANGFRIANLRASSTLVLSVG
jgi:hypothetical protein